MKVTRTQQKAPKTRPKKKPSERRRREKAQRQRLIALGLSKKVVDQMSAKEVRDKLKRPAKIKKAG